MQSERHPVFPIFNPETGKETSESAALETLSSETTKRIENHIRKQMEQPYASHQGFVIFEVIVSPNPQGDHYEATALYEIGTQTLTTKFRVTIINGWITATPTQTEKEDAEGSAR